MDEQPLRKLPVDLRELEFAFEWNHPEAHYYLNLETGALVFVTEEDRQLLSEFGPDDPENPSRIALEAVEVEENLGTVYIEVPSVSSRDGYEFMREFIETIADARLQDALWNAINERKPFRRFRAVLDYHPTELEQWYAYKSARVLEMVKDWLSNVSVELIDTPQAD